MTTGKVTRKPGGMTMLGGKLVEAVECVEIDYGKQGVSRAFVVLAPPLSPEAKKAKQERIDQIVREMWATAQEKRRLAAAWE